MTLAIYLPTNLEKQIEDFKTSSGNINVDYRTTDIGSLNVLNTSYTRVIIPTSVDLDCLPIKTDGEHISGYNQLFKEFPVDVLLENITEQQRHYFYAANTDQIVSVRYSHTESERVGNISNMLHYYYSSMTDSFFSGKTIKPGIYDSVTVKQGLINTRDCLAMSCINIPITLSGGMLKLTQQVPEVVTNSLDVPADKVDPRFLGMQSILVSRVVEPKVTSKTRLIAIIGEDDSVVGSPVLNNRLSNYNLYCIDTNSDSEMFDAISFPLKGGEKALFSTTIVNSSNNYLGEIGNVLISFSEKFSPELGNSFACLKISLPDSPHITSYGIPKELKISVDDGTTWTVLKNYSNQDVSVFREDIVEFFKSKGIKCYPAEDSTYILQNISNLDNKFVIQYHPDFYVESVTNETSIIMSSGNEFMFTSNSFPDNLSVSSVELYVVEEPPPDDDPEYVEYAFRLPPVKTDEVLSDLFKNSIQLTMDKLKLITTSSYKYLSNGEVVEKLVDMSVETEETVSEKVLLELSDTFTDCSFTIEEDMIIVSNVTSDWFEFALQYEGISIKNESIYLIEEVDTLYSVLLKGV